MDSLSYNGSVQFLFHDSNKNTADYAIPAVEKFWEPNKLKNNGEWSLRFISDRWM